MNYKYYEWIKSCLLFNLPLFLFALLFLQHKTIIITLMINTTSFRKGVKVIGVIKYDIKGDDKWEKTPKI